MKTGKIVLSLIIAVFVASGALSPGLAGAEEDSKAGLPSVDQKSGFDILKSIGKELVNGLLLKKGSADASEANSESENSDKGLRLVWEADDCGCTPIQPDIDSAISKMTYGFYHKNMEPEEDDDQKTATAKIKFSRLNRIGYYSLGYDAEKGVMESNGWENNGFVKTARQYNSRVDLVVDFSDNPGNLFKSISMLLVMTQEIERLVKEYDSTGVTIELRNMSNLEGTTMHSFVLDLREKLTALGQGRYLNLFFVFDEGEETETFNSLPLDQMTKMKNAVDLFLVMVLPDKNKDDPAKAKDRFLALSQKIEKYCLKTDDIELKKKIIPVLHAGNGNNGAIFNQILLMGYGGVGLWPEKELSGEATEFIAKAFKNHPDILQRDTISKLLFEYFPDLCKLICPNRTILYYITGIFGGALALFFILSFFICELRVFARSHVLYFAAGVLIIMILVAGLILCVPRLQGQRGLALALLFACGAGYMIMDYFRRRREAKFP
jgi:hypothetical protein